MMSTPRDRTPPTPRLPGLFDLEDEDRRTVAQQTRYDARRDVPRPLGSPKSGYVDAFDRERLTGQLRAVFLAMEDGEYRTLAELKAAVGKGTETGLSAALRSLRKRRYGAHRVNKRRRGDPRSGLFEYQLIVNRGER